jgi:hypothetical protein
VSPSRTVTLRRGFDSRPEAEALPRDQNGNYVIHIEELERVELQVGATDGQLLVNGEQRPLPIGSTLKGGVFYWQAGPGFLGNYDLLFERPAGASVRTQVVIHPKSW